MALARLEKEYLIPAAFSIKVRCCNLIAQAVDYYIGKSWLCGDSNIVSHSGRWNGSNILELVSISPSRLRPATSHEWSETPPQSVCHAAP